MASFDISEITLTNNNIDIFLALCCSEKCRSNDHFGHTFAVIEFRLKQGNISIIL